MSHASKSSGEKGAAPFNLKLPPKTHKSTTNKRSSGTSDSSHGESSQDETMPQQPAAAVVAKRLQHTDEQLMQMLKTLHGKYPKSGPRALQYGTAGFRDKADYLDWVMYRMGILAALRSKFFKGGYVGVMITASHNPAEDNGVKLIDTRGEMLDASWENEATYMIMCHDDNLGSQINGLLRNKSIDFAQAGNVMVARDTRASSEALAQAVKDGVSSIGCTFHDCGLLTTPQLHYLVALHNKGTTTGGSEQEQKAADKTEQAYYTNVHDAFKQLYQSSTEQRQQQQNPQNGEVIPNDNTTQQEGGGMQVDGLKVDNYQSNIRVDCANGIGALKLKPMADMLLKDGTLKITLTNTGECDGDVLNEQCGADFVKIQQAVPRNFENTPLNSKCASFDGDADRLIYFYVESSSDISAASAAVHSISPDTHASAAASASASDIQRQFRMLDGDKIATLLATYIIDKVRAADIEKDLKIGVVQTAYANGASTHYLRERMRMQVDFVPTGVKYLHKQAHEYDIGIYFEANGHGTVLFNENCMQLLQSKRQQAITSDSNDIDDARKRNAAVGDLIALSSLINQTTGDAICDMLAVEIVLLHYGWSIADWDRMYVDLPNRQLKVTVQDRRKIKVANAERRCTEPAELQPVIERMVLGYGQARAFVRPSGTEDVVRVYAEASTREGADELAFRIAEEVWCKAGGVGVRPEPLAQHRRCAATVATDSLIS